MKRTNLMFIKSRRKKLKITLQSMSESLGYSHPSTYMKYEEGEYQFKANQLPIIAEMLKCEINDLFFEQNFADSAKSNSA